jgi:pyruvate dehydrogenase E2 component (dihydrolipoamide acetyltransferase)
MTEESAIVEWRKKEGDRIVRGDILFTVETDKSVMDVEAFEEGTLLKIVVAPGRNVPVQSVVGFLGEPGEVIPEVAAPAKKIVEVLPVKNFVPPVAAVETVAAAPKPVAIIESASRRLKISPRARALAESCVIDPSKIIGTGPDGRVVEKDVQAYLEAKGYQQLQISPAAKALAAKERLDVLAIREGGEGGRIGVTDVERAVAEKPKAMSKMRQVIAQRLTQSVVTAPHFYVTVSVDMTELMVFRNELKATGAPYTITNFISQAVVLTLKEFPDVNSSTDGKTIRWNSRVHLGLAVSLETGLVAPVIRDADELTFAELSTQSKNLAEKAHSGKLTPDQMTGSTFTISNMGMLDVENFTAIINTGEAAILAVSSTLPQPVVRDGKVVVRQMMKTTLSSDHRLVDGAMAARFVNAIKAKLEDVESWIRLTS